MPPQPKGRVGGGAYCFRCRSLRRRRPRCSLPALFLLNQWMDFDHTCIDTFLGRKKKVKLDFGDLWLIFKVTQNFQIFKFWPKSLSTPCLLNQMTDSGQTSNIVMLGWFKDLFRFWWIWPNFQGPHTIKTVNWALSALYLLNQLVDFDQTCVETPLGHGEEIIRFLWPWPHCQGHTSTLNVKYWPKLLVCTLFLEPNDGFWPNFTYCITGIIKRTDKILVALT